MTVMRKIWRYARWPLAVVLVVWLWFVIAAINWPVSQEKSDAAVAAIHAQRLTMVDVDGSNLPPEPDPAKVNATLEGIDANENGIRDDVELAIFKKYPNDMKVRAAELQYAMSLQLELTKILNTETFVSVTGQTDRAFACVYDTSSERSVSTARIEEVEKLVFNNLGRQEAREKIYERFMTSVTSNKDTPCDLAI